MKKATLQRFIHDKVTFGKLSFEWIEGHPDIYTIELPFLDNKPLISCIPQGLYNVIPHNSKKYPDTWQILNVPDRTAILFHSGNYACEVMLGKNLQQSDTRGCILPGLSFDKSVPMVKSSVKAMDWMRGNIKGEWSLEVKNNLPQP